MAMNTRSIVAILPLAALTLLMAACDGGQHNPQRDYDKPYINPPGCDLYADQC